MIAILAPEADYLVSRPDSKELADYLLYEGGVACLDGQCFGAEGRGYLRFSYANSLENILDAVERIRKGNTIVIFPEEGRSREVAMRPFQRGAFLLSIRSELPILPLAIDGTYEVFRVGANRITKSQVPDWKPIGSELHVSSVIRKSSPAPDTA